MAISWSFMAVHWISSMLGKSDCSSVGLPILIILRNLGHGSEQLTPTDSLCWNNFFNHHNFVQHPQKRDFPWFSYLDLGKLSWNNFFIHPMFSLFVLHDVIDHLSLFQLGQGACGWVEAALCLGLKGESLVLMTCQAIFWGCVICEVNTAQIIKSWKMTHFWVLVILVSNLNRLFTHLHWGLDLAHHRRSWSPVTGDCYFFRAK